MDAKVVRLQGKSHDQATPYLREWLPKMLADGMLYTVRSVDLACGNMRNTKFLWESGMREVVALDMKPDANGAELWNASSMIPIPNWSAGLILCQYLLMFLDADELHHVLCEISRVAAPKCVLVVELQKVKQGRELLAAPIFGALCRLAPSDIEWRCIHMSKMRFIAQRQ